MPLKLTLRALAPLFLALMAFAPSAFGADLLNALEAAMRSDPQLREAEANLFAAREAKPQAWSALKPQITGQASTTRSEATGQSAFTAVGGVPLITIFESRTLEDRRFSLNITQTVFRKDQFIALDSAQARILQAEADYRAAELDLLQRVSQRYFDVLGAQSDLDAVRTTKEAVARQLEQAETRFDVGLIAVTDVREAQAAYDQAVADEIQSKRSLGTSKELLREITGEYYEELLAPGDLPLMPPSPASAEDWVVRAKAENATVVSAEYGVDVAHNELRSRRAQHYPTLDLVVQGADNNTNQRTNSFQLGAPEPGFQPSDSDSRNTSIGLQLNVPIYSGGFRGSRAKEAVYLERAAKERLERAIRETERQTRDSYAGVLSEIARVGALEKALESSRTALQATEAGFEVGTRTTVDVLNARQDLARARTNYERSRYVYITNLITLKLSSGQLTGDDLAAINQSLTEPVTELP
ncbi:MAG: TolC family outer membrane protein [Pseudomonadota bacterium]